MGGFFCWVGLMTLERKGQLTEILADARRRPWVQLGLVFLAVVVAGIAVVLASGLLQSRIDKFLATRAGSDMLTLTGRNEIWAIALDTFRQNPWFGYGPTIWDPYFRMMIGVPAAFHAHNQYINILAASGVVGGLGFVAYFYMLLRRIWSRLLAYRGFALGLLLLILTRSVSEVPFGLERLGSESLMQLLMLMVLAGAPASASGPATGEAREGG